MFAELDTQCSILIWAKHRSPIKSRFPTNVLKTASRDKSQFSSAEEKSICSWIQKCLC